MAKRRAENQNVNLTFDHLNSQIAVIFLRVGGVPHTLRKFLTRVTTLL
jgi:hypothetical protein